MKHSWLSVKHLFTHSSMVKKDASQYLNDKTKTIKMSISLAEWGPVEKALIMLAVSLHEDADINLGTYITQLDAEALKLFKEALDIAITGPTAIAKPPSGGLRPPSYSSQSQQSN